MTQYNDYARNALDIDNATKADLNNAMLNPLSASVLKKTSRADLVAMVEAQDAVTAAPNLTDLEKRVTVAYLEAGIDCNGAKTFDAMLADNMTWGDVPAIAKATGLTQNQVQGVIASLDKKGLLVITGEGVNGKGPVQQVLSDDGLRVAFELMADGVEGKPVKARPKAEKPARKARGLDDRVIQAPGKAEDVRPTKEGSKRALLVIALQSGVTIEHLMEVLCWNRETVSSALRTDLKAIGVGCERRESKYHLLLPEGMKKLPLSEATITRADALVTACK
jgi:hypothetical protein